MHWGTEQSMREQEQSQIANTYGSTLDPSDWSDFRQQAHTMLDDMIDYTEKIRARPVWQPIPETLRARFRGPLPSQPTDLGTVHDEFMHDILPFAIGNVHPGFMGWVHGGGTPVGMLAEMLAAGLNANLGGRDHIPIEIERQVTEWMRRLFGFAEGATGIFVTGTSVANLIAVTIARDIALGFEVRKDGIATKPKRLACYGSASTHNSIGKALDISGVGTSALRSVPSDHLGRISIPALERMIAEDRQNGHTPFLVVATAGTVDIGAIDDLSSLADLCRREELWLHVDGAYGALAMLAPDLAPRLKGIERANSIGFDFHKWGQVPYDAGFILVQDGESHQRAFESTAAYLKRETRGMAAGQPWPCDFGPDLSRGFHALKVWFTLKVYGAEALGAIISKTCELARYLEKKIVQTPELELLAPVALNIVCFRYRSQASDHINRQIVVDLQECGCVAPSTTLIDGRIAIRSAIVNHRTSRTEIDTLVEQVLIFGRALESAATKRPIAQQPPMVHERTMLQLALSSVEKRLEFTPDSTELLFQQAALTEATGRTLEARSMYQRMLHRDSCHVGVLNNLGSLLMADREVAPARVLFERAVEHYPLHLVSRANLGNLLIKSHEFSAACEHFEATFRVDPNYRPGHAGLSCALDELGETERASLHRRKAFANRAVVITRYRGEQPPIIVLELVSVTGGNIRTDEFLSDKLFQRIFVTAEFYDPRMVLPPHDFVFNAIGDADCAVAALTGALTVVSHTSAPVINPPAAVLATGRCAIAQRLSVIPGVLTANTLMLSRDLLVGSKAAAVLAERGFSFPLLLRTPGFHGGDHFVRVEAIDELTAAIESLPGEELLVIQYLDARGPDGKSRKYRVMMVDGKLYPLHLAISDHWKIHYFSADMAESTAHRAEDAAFLDDMGCMLGPHVIDALQEIQRTLALDYGGIDFGLNNQGDVLLFEANATMAVIVPDEDSRWDYRRSAVDRIYSAVDQMLRGRAKNAVAVCEKMVSSAEMMPLQASNISDCAEDAFYLLDADVTRERNCVRTGAANSRTRKK
jgi:aromatic-L-amino-acid/L-tryptophan decarboxylase